jgi:tetratricopeptide (TPR) repeat protein
MGRLTGRRSLAAVAAFSGLWFTATPCRGEPGDAGPSAVEADAGPGTERMAGLVDEAFAHLARARNLEGIAALQEGDLPRALARFKEAHDLAPADPEVTNNLAFAHERLGNAEDAERWYRVTLAQEPGRGVAHLNLADLLSGPAATPHRLQEAASLLQRARELRGNDARVLLKQARVAARLGQFEVADRFYGALLAAEPGPPSPERALEMGDFYRDFTRFDDALAWYRRAPEAAAERIRTLEVEREARRWGMQRVQPDVPEQARTLAARGRRALAEGRVPEASALLVEALRLAPRFTSARIDLAAALETVGRLDEAERHLLLGLALDHGDAELHLRLARLYRPSDRHPGLPSRAGESLILLSQAAQLEPDRWGLDWELALSAQATGDLARALRHVRRFLERAPSDAADRPAAQVLLHTLERAVGQPGPADPPPAGAGGPSGSDETASGAALAAVINRARGYLARGEADAALAELGRVPDAERQHPVQALRARILHALGRLDEAAGALMLALEAADEATAPALETELARLRFEQGRPKEARLHLRSGEAAGLPEALLLSARLDVDAATAEGPWSVASVERLRGARARLSALAASGHPDPRAATAARELSARIDAAFGELWFAGFVGAGGLFVLAAFLALRRFGGADLARFLRRHPEAGPDVQRILSAIRHEVLKHNTLMLSGLVDALATGRSAGDLAAFCRRSLLGEPGAPGAVHRLRDAARQLERTARAHGVRLNLRHRDPALSALLLGFARLQAVERDLARVSTLSPRAIRRLTERLTQAAHLLNVEGYEAVRSLLDALRVLRVDATLLAAMFERARREPALAEVALAPPDIRVGEVPELAVALPRAALEDILVNLVRNAIQSTLRHGPAGPVRIGLFLDEELDEITGLSRALFSVLDCSPQVLTREMLRGRYIEAGLGLTADLVTRYEGTLDLGPAPPPYTKAVQVKLPVSVTESAPRTDEHPGARPIAFGSPP